MSEILKAIKTKDKVIIVSAMAVFAILLAVTVGIITAATIDVHNHKFEYHIEKGTDGGFDLVGICTDVECLQPVKIVDVSSDVAEEVTLAPTCCSEGVMKYSYTLAENNKTYTYTEKIPSDPHNYFGNIVDGNINAKCVNTDCTSRDLAVTGATEIKLESVVDATCHTPKIENYSYSANGVTGMVAVLVEEYTEHKLNGVYVTEFEISDGVYKYGTAGMTITSGDTLLCGQQAEGSYTCEVCEKSISAMIRRDDHVFVYDESQTVRPTALAAGSAVVKCTNDGCTESISVTLPMAVEGENATLVSKNHIAKTKTLGYSFTSSEYGFTVEFQFDIDFEEHTFVYIADESRAPTLTTEGEAVIRCSYEGCNETVRLALAKIEIGSNSTVIADATEISRQTVKYVYSNAQYDINIELTLEAGEKLSHNYVYALELEGDTVSLVGRCSQPGCQTPVICDDDAEISYEFFEATCTEYARKVWTCGEYTYVKTLTEDGLAEHVLVYVANDTVYPTLDSNGRAYVRCTGDGCTKYDTIILPKVVEGENAEVKTDLDIGIKEFDYTFVCEEYGFTVTHHFAIIVEHLHNYEFTLDRVDGEFVLSGVCHKIPCNFNSTVEIPVQPNLSVNTTTCTTLGKLVWVYVHEDGSVHDYQENSTEYAPHSFEMIEDGHEAPSVYMRGSVTIKCTASDCGHEETITLPRAVEGVNSVVARVEENIDMKFLAYTYYSSEHDFTYECEVPVMMDHTHDYKYALTKENGEFFMVGTCQKNPMLCDQRTVSEPVEATLVHNSATCVSYGKLIWSCAKDGAIFTYEEDGTAFGDHVIVEVESERVAPTFEADGSAYFKCTTVGCTHDVEVTLPMMEMDGNTESVRIDIEAGVEYLRYTFTASDFDIDVVIEFTRLYDHTHDYVYDMVPSDGGVMGNFNIVGKCSTTICGDEIVPVENAEATLVSNSSTCIELGSQVWSYEWEGEVYTCQTQFPIYGEHVYEYDAKSSSTVLPGIDSEGLILVFCGGGCRDMVQTVLPKLEVGVNANLLEETDEAYVYEYVYVTDLVTITLNITVSK